MLIKVPKKLILLLWQRVSQPHMSGNCPVTMLISQHCPSMGFRPIMIFEWQIKLALQMSKLAQFKTFYHVSQQNGEVHSPVYNGKYMVI